MSRFQDSTPSRPGNEAGPWSELEARLRDLHVAGRAPAVVVIDREREERAELELEAELEGVVYLGEENRSAQQAGTVFRNPRIPRRAILTECRCRDFCIKEGTTVEIKQRPSKEHRVQFVKVSHIYRSPCGGIVLRGLPLTRLRHSQGMLRRRRNEVYSPMEIDEDDERDWHTQAAIEVPIDQVLLIRTLQTTNAIYPEFRLRESQYASKQEAEDHGILTHRCNIVTTYKTASDREKGKLCSRTIQNLHEKDADEELRIPMDVLMNRWRGGRVRGGGASENGGRQRPVITIDDEGVEESHLPTIGRDQKYSFADMYCGAGGVSAGARLACFEPIVACDSWSAACKSYRKNFPTVDLHEKEISDFCIEIPGNKYRPDVLHVSPPCQVWSPVHTRPGKNDDANLAALYACDLLLKKLRPRIVTVEQTFGILHDRFQEYFNLFIDTFTSVNYSVSYKVVNLSEELPSFPEPSDLEPATVRNALRTIGPRATLHNVEEMQARAEQYSSRFPRPPYNANGPLNHTMTCDGGGNYHPSGKRDFTLREYAAIQGFPSSHQFERPGIKKQIGNAFPPSAVEFLYRHLRSWLMRRDGVVDEDGDDGIMVLDENPWVVIVDSIEDDVVMLDDCSEQAVDESHDDNNDNDNEDDHDDVVLVEWRERSRTLSIGSSVDMDLD
ncbi:S-adenosyl-L-methionine-dependent methyltransferase [Xylariaceae sp. FL0662B]|nr:S-adenosyl-L-methionine-dependent methyltransferase [Xylariaceae sp. FL0662B]